MLWHFRPVFQSTTRARKTAFGQSCKKWHPKGWSCWGSLTRKMLPLLVIYPKNSSVPFFQGGFSTCGSFKKTQKAFLEGRMGNWEGGTHSNAKTNIYNAIIHGITNLLC